MTDSAALVQLYASFGQTRLWILDQIKSGLEADHISGLWSLQGSLNQLALQQALDQLLIRHESLRTSFCLEDGQLMQRIHPPLSCPLQRVSLAVEMDSDECIQKQSQAPFDLSQAPLIRATLMERSADQHLLLISVHHLACDAWSLSLLLKELSLFYQASCLRKTADLPALPIQYADFSVWQRQRLLGGRRERLLAYWRRQLADLEPLELPSDHARPAEPSYRGGSLVFELDVVRSRGLESLCQGQGATLQMGLLALVAVLLQRYSRSDTIPIGVPHWGRDHPDLEGLVGFFVNILVLRCDLSEGPSFLEALARVKSTSLEAYGHQDLPFEELVEALQPERDRSRHPLVQVMVQLLDVPETRLSLPGLTVDPLPQRTESVRFDLEFLFRRHEQGLRVSIGYSTDLFDASRMERLRGHWTELVDGVLAEPQRPLDQLSILTAGESEQLIAWSQGSSLVVPELLVHELFERQVERTPEAVALVFGGQELSYGELNARANRLAQRLRGLGLGPGGMAAVCLERSLELVVSLLAILKAGGAYLPLDPSWPLERQQLLLNEAGCCLMLKAQGPEFLPSRRPTQAVNSGPPLAYVNYTSGSTGLPKAVAVGHPAILRLVHPVNGFLLGVGQRVLQLAPVAFDAATFEIWGPLLNGGTLVIAPPGQLSLLELAGVLRQEKISTLWLTAGLFHAMVESELEALAGVRQVLAGGDVLSPAHVQRLLNRFPPGHGLINGYGPTENTTFTCCHRLEAGAKLDSGGVPLGRPIATTVVRVLDRAGLPCPIGIPGELHIGGAGLAHGYLNDPKLTAARFIEDPFSEECTARLYQSGDLVSWNPDGTLAFHGRIDQQIKLRGFRIEPGEIESHLLTHPAVAQAAVVIHQDNPANPMLVAYWVASGATVEVAGRLDLELRRHLQARLPEAMVPAAFVALEALPLTSNGKLDRRALPAPAFLGSLKQRVEPSSALERQLHAIWSEVLGHSDFGVNDNFFVIGGHSLAAARLVSRLEQAIGIAPTLSAFFQHPSIAELAGQLTSSDAKATGVATIPPAPPLAGDWPSGCLAFHASFAQSRLWFLHQLQPALTAYHLPQVWRLKGELNLQALALALADVIERHPTLRTAFRLQGSEVLQVIHPPGPVALDPEPLSDRPPQAVVEHWLNEERTTPFDLRSGLLLRVRLLQLDGDQHLLLINHHHIASDGWSLSLLFQDLGQLYNAHRSGRSPGLKPLKTLYHDFAVWQRQRLRGERLQALKNYWMTQLTDLEPLQFPCDHPRPPSPSYQGDSVSFEVAPELLAPFQELCRREGATLQMGLIAVLALLLHRHSRQDDIAIGVPIWGRNHPDLEPLIGFFINTLPIRIQVQHQQSFRQLLQQVKATSLAAYDHQELPFEQIVEALQLPRDTSRNPLVQVMLQLIELPENTLNNLDGLSIDAIPFKAQSAHLDLSFSLRRTPDHGLTGSITYATDLFSSTRIEYLAAQLLCLLSATVDAAEIAIDHLNLLPDAERQLIQSWQDGPCLAIPDLCLHQLFEEQAERTPELVALIGEGQQLTYQQLNARANQLAHHLINLGVGPDQFVGLCLERGLEMVVALLAILKAGAAYVALDPAYPVQRLAYMLQDSAPKLLLVHQATRHLLASSYGATLLELDGDSTSWSAGSSLNPDPLGLGLKSHNLAYLIYTSGSTGQPKGVMVEHRSAVNFITWARSEFPVDLVRRTLFGTSINFDLAVYECFLPLAVGGACVIVPNAVQAGAALADVSLINTVPSVMHALLRNSKLPANVRAVNLAGEPLTGDLAHALFRRSSIEQLCNLYGPTETTTYSTWAMVKPDQAFAAHIGRPIANTHIYLLDDQGQPVPIGVIGELYIGGAGVSRGYLHQAELTAARFLADPFAKDQGVRMYKTGDLARWLPNGNLEFIGRADFQIKLRGFRIELGEIEAQLRRCVGVDEAVVVVREDRAGDPHLVAFLTGSPPEPSHLRASLATSLPQHMLPDAFVLLPSLPLTRNGKVDRQALPSPTFAGTPNPCAAPRTARERQLLALWSEVLGHSAFGIEDNFFQVGGHSLAAARLAALADRHWPNELSVARIFLYPTIAQQSIFLAERQPARQPANLVSLQPQGDRLPLYLTHGWGGGVGHFVALARAMAPHRPVFGLQASAFLLGQADGPRESVREMAASYAQQILKRHGEGPIHLLGFSGGGWYAFAVAAVLLERGARIGMLAVLDTHASARIHRRLGVRLLAHQAKASIVPALAAFVDPPTDQGRRQLLLDQLRSLNGDLDTCLGVRLPSPSRLLSRVLHRPGSGMPSDPYIRWLRMTYRPPRLPLTVDLFATPTSLRPLQRLWSFYALGGVRKHRLFADHLDFMGAERMPELAAALEAALEPLERS